MENSLGIKARGESSSCNAYNETEKVGQLRHGQILKRFRADRGAEISWIRREANYPRRAVHELAGLNLDLHGLTLDF